MGIVLCTKCENELYDLSVKGEIWEGDICSNFDEKKIKIEGFKFCLSLGDECGSTCITYICRCCGEKGSVSVWGGGQLGIDYSID